MAVFGEICRASQVRIYVGIAVVQPLLPAVAGPPVPELFVPPDAGLAVKLVSVDDSLVGPVIVHDRVGAVEQRGGREVLSDDAMRARHFGAVCKRQQRSRQHSRMLKEQLLLILDLADPR